MKKKQSLSTPSELWANLKPWQRKFLRIQGDIVYSFVVFIDSLYRVDLWLFPPGMFYATYVLTIKSFPDHPIKTIAVLSTSFMFAALSLLLIRPRKIKWKKVAHWVKY